MTRQKFKRVKNFGAEWTKRYPRPAKRTNEYAQTMVRPFCRKHGKLWLHEVTREIARDWAASHPGQVRYVRTMFNDALEDGYIEYNPFSSLRVKQNSKGRANITLISEDEVLGLIEAAPPILKNAIRFAAYTGIRICEQLGLEWSDFSEDMTTARVERQRDRFHRIIPPKTPASVRTIVIPGSGRISRDEKLARPFPMHYHQHHYHWMKLRQEVGMGGVKWHDFRHFCVTWMLDQGATFEQVADQIGHDDEGELIRKIYRHRNKERDREALLARLSTR